MLDSPEQSPLRSIGSTEITVYSAMENTTELTLNSCRNLRNSQYDNSAELQKVMANAKFMTNDWFEMAAWNDISNRRGIVNL